jgi:hypothetical protein
MQRVGARPGSVVIAAAVVLLASIGAARTPVSLDEMRTHELDRSEIVDSFVVALERRLELVETTAPAANGDETKRRVIEIFRLNEDLEGHARPPNSLLREGGTAPHHRRAQSIQSRIRQI